jgi:hypothetical protein
MASNIPKDIKYTNIFSSKAPKIYPDWDFWYENTPSGNLAGDTLYRCSMKSWTHKNLYR